MRIEGIITPIITPMNGDESINYSSLEEQINRLIEKGVHGIFPAGTNGEAYALSIEEKESLFKETVEIVKGRVPVYAGTGCITTKETVELSKLAESVGVDALSIVSPFFAQLSQEEIYLHYKTVAGATKLPIILYNIPARTGNSIAPDTAMRLAEIPNIAGIKDSSGNFLNILEYLEIKNLRSDFSVLAGNDALILSTLLAGGDGAVAGCSNVYPRIISEIFNLFIDGEIDKAKVNQGSILGLRKLFKYGNPNTIVKKSVEILGFNVGSCRAPFNMVSDEAVKKITELLELNRDNGMN